MPLPALSYFLTREEWLCAYAAWIVSFEKKCWEVNGATAPSMEVDGVGAALRHGIRILAQAGYSFRALEVSLNDTEILAKGDEPIEPGNVRFLQRIANGAMPNPINAIRYLEQLVAGLGLSLDLDPARELLAEIAEDVEEHKASISQEDALEFALFLQEALRTIGISMRPSGAIN